MVPRATTIPGNPAPRRPESLAGVAHRLPLITPDPPVANRNNPIHRSLRGTLEGNVIRIVLIEDDDLMREWLGRSLSSRGHEVVRYRRADEAIKAVVADPPDVVLSDVHMPGMSGLEFGRALIEHRVATPLLLMTADPTEALADHAEEAGARAASQTLRQRRRAVVGGRDGGREHAANLRRGPDQRVPRVAHADHRRAHGARRPGGGACHGRERTAPGRDRDAQSRPADQSARGTPGPARPCRRTALARRLTYLLDIGFEEFRHAGLPAFPPAAVETG